jgi:hypothetical protein
VFTTAATLHYSQDDEELPFVQVMDGSVPFNVDQIIQGDILIRCRHLTFSKQRVSMFRSAFHTGYVPPNVMRLTKSQLDGACSDKRFPDDFFLDLIFEKVDVETAQKLLEDQQEEAEASRELEVQEEKIEEGVKKPVVKASSYDSMLHGDTRFWETIAKRRKEQVAQKNDDPMFGPSIGRRRGVSKANMTTTGADGKAGGTDANGPPNNERTHMESFSIGNEFDFLPQEISPTPAPTEAKEQEKDSLMEALMALDEDEGGSTLEDLGTEEIVFDHDAVAPIVQPSTSQPEYSDPWSEIPASAPTTGGDEQQPPADLIAASTSDITTTNMAPANESTPPANVGDGVDAAGSDDIDALLASADEDLGDIDLSAFDDDDDLDDLENMLKL